MAVAGPGPDTSARRLAAAPVPRACPGRGAARGAGACPGRGLAAHLVDPMTTTSPLADFARAFDFAARRHVLQRRKGEAAEPYINHLAEVAALLAETTGGDDPVLLIASLLHDTI